VSVCGVRFAMIIIKLFLTGLLMRFFYERDTVYCEKCHWLRLVPRLVLYRSKGGSVVIAIRGAVVRRSLMLRNTACCYSQ